MISIFSLLGEIIPRADKLRTAMVCVLMVINAALEVVSIGMVLPFITLFTTDAPLKKWPALERFATPIGITDDRELILFGCLVFFLVIALKSALTFAANVAVFRFIFMAQHRLAIELLNRHLHSNYIRASQVNSSEIINLLRQSVGFVYNGFIMPVTTALADALMILATAGIMLAVEPWATLAAAVAVGLPAVCLNYFLRPRLESLGHARERGNSQTLRALNEALGSLKEATVLRTRRYFLGRYADQDLNFNRIFVKWMTLNQIPRAILETAALGSIFVVVYVILQREGPKEHALAVLALFGAATLRTLPAALRIIQGLNQARFAKGGIETVWTALKDYPPVVTETHQHLPTVSPVHEITFQGVGYRYPSGGPVLHDVNLSLHRGEMVGIIGPSGAGKTTFVDLLMGLLKPTEGRITADGGDITAYGDRWLVHFGYVPQHVFMADDTIERNVAFGIPDDRIDRAAVDRALSAVRLDEFASQAPGRSSTYVGERGNKLSGGQLQRIGIARALYHNPEVLILDEPTSALNAELEREFLELVRGMKIDKTIIIISHRERMLDYCDRVLRVERGTVSESRKETPAA